MPSSVKRDLTRRKQALRGGHNETYSPNKFEAINLYWEVWTVWVDGHTRSESGYVIDARADGQSYRWRFPGDSLVEADKHFERLKRTFAIRATALALGVPIPPEGEINTKGLER
jgi:hypothetical protein